MAPRSATLREHDAQSEVEGLRRSVAILIAPTCSWKASNHDVLDAKTCPILDRTKAVPGKITTKIASSCEVQERSSSQVQGRDAAHSGFMTYYHDIA